MLLALPGPAGPHWPSYLDAQDPPCLQVSASRKAQSPVALPSPCQATLPRQDSESQPVSPCPTESNVACVAS